MQLILISVYQFSNNTKRLPALSSAVFFFAIRCPFQQAKAVASSASTQICRFGQHRWQKLYIRLMAFRWRMTVYGILLSTRRTSKQRLLQLCSRPHDENDGYDASDTGFEIPDVSSQPSQPSQPSSPSLTSLTSQAS